MKKFLLAATTAALISLTGMQTAVAQDNRPGFYPIEMWACSFNDRKDQDDMDSVYEQIAEEGDTPYAAWQLNPYMAGNRNDQFDFIYIGAWPNGNMMGSDVANLFSGVYQSSEAWNETVSCAAFMYTGIGIQENPDEEDDHYFVTISDCNSDEGVSNGQALNGIRRYNDWLVENGHSVGTQVWFPAHGGGNADFDFKLIHVYAGPEDWGNAWQWRINNTAVQARRNYMSGVVSCDESRLYSTRTLMDTLDAE
jgi:hypothetical protein